MCAQLPLHFGSICPWDEQGQPLAGLETPQIATNAQKRSLRGRASRVSGWVGPWFYHFKDDNCKGFQIPKGLAMRLSQQLMTHGEMIRGMWSLLSLFEDFLWAKHDSFIYPLSEEYSFFFFPAIRKVCDDFLNYFRYVRWVMTGLVHRITLVLPEQRSGWALPSAGRGSRRLNF